MIKGFYIDPETGERSETQYSSHAERAYCELSELVRAHCWDEAEAELQSYCDISFPYTNWKLVTQAAARLERIDDRHSASHEYRSYRCATPLGEARYKEARRILAQAMRVENSPDYSLEGMSEALTMQRKSELNDESGGKEAADKLHVLLDHEEAMKTACSHWNISHADSIGENYDAMKIAEAMVERGEFDACVEAMERGIRVCGEKSVGDYQAAWFLFPLAKALIGQGTSAGKRRAKTILLGLSDEDLELFLYKEKFSLDDLLAKCRQETGTETGGEKGGETGGATDVEKSRGKGKETALSVVLVAGVVAFVVVALVERVSLLILSQFYL